MSSSVDGQVAARVGPAVEQRRRFTAWSDSSPIVPYLYLLPHALFFLAFVLYPLGQGLWISMHRYDPLRETQPFVGLANYASLFDFASVRAQNFWRAFANTMVFVALSTPLLIGVALGLALQLHKPIFGQGFFRSVFFLPGILSVAVIAILWRWIFNERNGLANTLLQMLGMDPVPFLTAEGVAWAPIVIATVWWTVGFNMTLYLAGLAAIPTSYYEAAEIDGAGTWAKFRYITVPLLGSTTLFVSVTTLLASFQVFGQTLLMTTGGPNRTTQSSIMYITQEAFTNNQLSAGTAMSFVFGVLMLIVTAVQFRLTARDARRPAR
jgi:multiple sugar transport system permease protein